jgi:hypothetical protein
MTCARSLLCAALLLGTLAATTIEPMSVERLAQESSLIVRGRAGESWVEWDEAGTLMYTYTRVAVSVSWKGTAAAGIVVKQPGGSDGRYTQRVSGVRYFRPGDDAVLFLKPSAAGASYLVTALVQGNFRVRRTMAGEEVASNGMGGARAYDRASGTVREYRGARMTVAELEARVRRAVE